jgi:tetratricopeptide (TPR) repeat protein
MSADKEIKKIDVELKNVDQLIAKNGEDQILKEHKASLLNNKGIELSKRDKHDEALKQILDAIELNPTHPIFFCNKSNFLQKLNRYTEAIEAADQSLALDPNYENAKDSLAASLNNQYVLDTEKGENDVALARIDRALELKPAERIFLCNKASVLNKLSRCEEALTFVEAALSIAPDFPNAKKVKAAILNKLSLADNEKGEYQAALDKVNKSIELSQNELAFYVNKGAYLISLKSFKEAGECADKVLSKDKANELAKQIKEIVQKNLKK